jgi:tape measure domain-containing protein
MAASRFDIFINVKGTRQVDRSFKQINKRVAGLNKTLGILRAALVVFASIRVFTGFTDLVDSFTNMQNKLRLVTRNAQELNGVMGNLFKIAQRTRTSFDSVTDLFFRMTNATGKLGLSFQDLFDVTETVSQAVVISGATTEEATNALIQFGQGLASGALQGEELRSVAEQLPKLAEIIGKEFGIAAGDLIAFNKAQKGVFKTERLISALTNAAKEVGDAFKSTNVTIAQAFVRFRNSLTVFVGLANEATGATEILAKGLTLLADNLDIAALALIGFVGLLGFNVLVNTLISSLGLLTAAFNFVFGGVVALTSAISGLIVVLFKLAATVAILLLSPFFLVTAITVLVAAWDNLGDTWRDFKKLAQELGSEVDALKAIFNQVFASIRAGFKIITEDFDLVFLVLKRKAQRTFNDMLIALEDFIRIAAQAIKDFDIFGGEGEVTLGTGAGSEDIISAAEGLGEVTAQTPLVVDVSLKFNIAEGARAQNKLFDLIEKTGEDSAF